MFINLSEVPPVVGLLASVWTVQATFSAAKRKSIVDGLVQFGRAARLGEVAREPTAESRGVFESARRKPSRKVPSVMARIARWSLGEKFEPQPLAVQLTQPMISIGDSDHRGFMRRI
jgi:hypothetical protein